MNRFLQILLPQCDASTRVWLSSVATSSLLHVLAGAALMTWLGSVAPRLFPPEHGFNSIQLTASQVIEVESTDEQQADSPPVTIAYSNNDAILVATVPKFVRQVVTSAEAAPLVIDGESSEAARTKERIATERMTVSHEPDVTSDLQQPTPRTHQVTKPPTASSNVASIASQQDAGQLDSLPVQVFSPQPEYPAAALQEGLEGRVVLRVAIDASGQVTAASLLRSSGHASLDQAARQAVLRWRFEPPLRLGIAVRTEIAIPIRFQIEQR